MNDRGAYLPMPEEIAARAAELRAQREAANQDTNGRGHARPATPREYSVRRLLFGNRAHGHGASRMI